MARAWTWMTPEGQGRRSKVKVVKSTNMISGLV